MIERDTCKAKQKRSAWPGGLESVGQGEVGGDLTWLVEADLIGKVTSEWRSRGRSERQLCGGGAGVGRGVGPWQRGCKGLCDGLRRVHIWPMRGEAGGQWLELGRVGLSEVGAGRQVTCHLGTNGEPLQGAHMCAHISTLTAVLRIGKGRGWETKKKLLLL